MSADAHRQHIDRKGGNGSKCSNAVTGRLALLTSAARECSAAAVSLKTSAATPKDIWNCAKARVPGRTPNGAVVLISFNRKFALQLQDTNQVSKLADKLESHCM